MTRLRTAQIIATAVEVSCPHCGGSQPNPDNGAFTWLPSEVEAAARSGEGKCVCVECDETFRIVASTHAQVVSDQPSALTEAR